MKNKFLMLLLTFPGIILNAQETGSLHFKSSKILQTFLNKYCLDCHDDEVQKGKVRLDNFSTLENLAKDEMLNKIEEQVYLSQMPPKKKKQPSDAEKDELFKAVHIQFETLGLSSKFTEKLKRPAYGNYVDHNKLFSGEYKDLKAFTYDRNWLISEYIFNEKINRIINYIPSKKINGKQQPVLGFSDRNVALTNPFLLPQESGVRYYANESLNGGHLLTMLSNARILGEYLTDEDMLKSHLKPVYKLLELEFLHNNTIKSRKKFLAANMETVLQNIYKGQNLSYMPRFQPLKLKFVKYGPKDKKTPYHWVGPDRNTKNMIQEKVSLYMKTAKSDEQIISMCEKDWFEEGVSPVILAPRLIFMHNYIDDIKKAASRLKTQKKQYRPLNSSEMAIIEKSIKKNRSQGDNYRQIIDKCAAEWNDLFKKEREQKGLPEQNEVAAMVTFLLDLILERSPQKDELKEYVDLSYSYINELGRFSAVKQLIETLFVKSEFSYRDEFGVGRTDQYGRRKMSAKSLSFALSYAITDSSPDKQLREAAAKGRLESKEDIAREVKRMLDRRDQMYVVDERLGQGKGPNAYSNVYSNTPVRKLRFFREFFGYPNFLSVFKDEKRFGGVYGWAKLRLLQECDQLVDHIIRKDKSVFEELLTTEKFYVYHSGDNQEMKKISDTARKQYEYFKDMNWQKMNDQDLKKHKKFLNETGLSKINGRQFQSKMQELSKVFSGGTKQPHPSVLRHPMVVKFFNIDLKTWHYPVNQPAKVPNRMGILTHPAWLIAHAHNTETDPVVRGKFIREKLLADTVPDVPISVEALVPEDHHKTLKQRLVKVTEVKECWGCHIKMNPLGYPFEIYDDFGRYRTEEALEHPDNIVEKRPGIGGNPRMFNRGDPYFDYRDVYKTLTVDAKGELAGTGDKKLDGEVTDAIDLIKRLAESTRVRQSFVRHAFRYFMGRNEMLSDSKTLIDADEAYVKSGGSFDALIVSLLTSDSFIYRKEVKE